jgi:hypothetical protein
MIFSFEEGACIMGFAIDYKLYFPEYLHRHILELAVVKLS